MENGEVSATNHTHTETSYDPAHEWPGETEVLQLRLRVQTSSVLPKSQRLAILDEYKEVQCGRDVAPAGSRTPRVRLKEMAVSKVHATIFWDPGRRVWAVVDMGSKHGSFLRSGGYIGPAVNVGGDLGIRLSPPRVASFPRALKHGDVLTIGSTTLMVHIHADHMPCEGCSSSESGENVLPLFPLPQVQKQVVKRERDEVNLLPPEGRDAKKALSMLKRTLLSRHNHASSLSSIQPSYVDRSAKRRALYPSSPLDIPGAPSSRSDSPSVASSCSIPRPENPLTPQPLPESNIGHRLLMKQGWQPGTALGSGEDASALTEPLEACAAPYRAGLGMPEKASTSFSGDWKESGKERRWAGLIDAK